MGDVGLVYKVTVEDQDDLSRIEEDLKKIDCAKLQWIKRAPFVFGTELIQVAYVIPDKVDGAMDKVEAFIESIKGVSSFNNESMTLVS